MKPKRLGISCISKLGPGMFLIVMLALSSCTNSSAGGTNSYTLGNAELVDPDVGTSYVAGSYGGMEIEVPSETTVESLSIFVRSFSSGTQLRMALHTSSGSFPDALVIGSGIQTLTTGWMTFDVADTPITAGTYFIGYQSDGVVAVRYIGTGAVARDGAQGLVYAITDSWGDNPANSGSNTTANDLNLYMTVRD